MNTAPNRRASDNASSPPGTSPTRRFSDMLKESSGSGVRVVHIDMASTQQVVALIEGSSRTVPAIHYDVPDGDVIFMVRDKNNDGFVTTMLANVTLETECVGVDPDTISENEYTFTGTTKLLAINTITTSTIILIIPTSIELIPGPGTQPHR